MSVRVTSSSSRTLLILETAASQLAEAEDDSLMTSGPSVTAQAGPSVTAQAGPSVTAQAGPSFIIKRSYCLSSILRFTNPLQRRLR